jgi:GNAT superfamily N-acetyltransferase
MNGHRRQPELRLLSQTDSVAELTELLHRAYQPLADAGMRFYASHQDEETTRDRASKGECWVAIIDQRIVGTIVMSRPKLLGKCPWYEREDVARFGQYAVEPALQRRGIGILLLNKAEERARAGGAAELALDTSEDATDLIKFYTKRGYRPVDRVEWNEVNYKSVVMSRNLQGK